MINRDPLSAADVDRKKRADFLMLDPGAEQDRRVEARLTTRDLALPPSERLRRDPERVTRKLAPDVFVLLSTYNGAAYLEAQLESLERQTHGTWKLYWRDDGSTDTTIAILSAFCARVGSSRCVRVREPQGRVWPTQSYMALLNAVLPELHCGDVVAFADQDDVWLPDKLARGISALRQSSRDVPALYCARLMVVDQNLRRLHETSIIRLSERCFPASLTQNIATGCTVLLNRSAALLVARSRPPSASIHDWWSYLLVTAAGGRVVVDRSAVALYRQHRYNLVGMQPSWASRAIAALRRGPGPFMNVLRQHVEALTAQPDLLCETSRPVVARLHAALNGGLLKRFGVLRMAGLRRQSRLETFLFRLWFLIG